LFHRQPVGLEQCFDRLHYQTLFQGGDFSLNLLNL
jgi:hypothetical protein